MDFLNTIGNKLVKSRKLQITLLLVFLVVFIGVIIPGPARAVGILQTMGYLIAGLIWPVIWLFGRLIEMMIWLIIQVTSYNGFIDATAVKIGWYLVRDICNLFFIIVLLTIAVSTVLGIQRYNYRNLLGKFVLMVVLINFSRLIAGFWIDFSQVIMMTFVVAFQDHIAAGIFSGAGIGKLLHLSGGEIGQTEGAISVAAVVGSTLLAAIMVIVMFGVLLALFIIFLVRIMMLWMLIILSPLSYLLYIFPGGKPQNSKYWQMFWQYIMIGPVLAFFLWLSIMLIYESGGNPSNGILNNESERAQTFLGNDTKYAAITEITEAGNFLNYGMTIALLVFAMMFAQQSGVAGAKFAGKAMAAASTIPWKGAKNAIGYGHRKLYSKTGIQLNPMKIVEGIRATMDKRRRDDETRGAGQAGDRMKRGGLGGVVTGFLGASQDASEAYVGGFLNYKGIRRGWRSTIHGEKGVAAVQEELDGERQELRTQRSFVGEDGLGQDQRVSLWGQIDEQQEKLERTENKAKRQKIENKIDKLTERAGNRSLTKMSRDQMKKEIELRKEGMRKTIKVANKLQERLDKIQPPEAFYATRERRQLQDEEAKKIDSTNEEELIQMFRSAVASGDMTQAAAILKQATKAGHLNEMINHGASASRDTYLDVDGNITFDASKAVGEAITKEGQRFTSDQDGMNAFMQDVMMKKFGMAEQEAYSLQSDLSDLAQNVGHWEYGQTVGVKNGRMFQRTKKEATMRSTVEMGKKDQEKLMREMSRLGYGGETVDEFDPTKRKFHIDTQGAVVLRRNYMMILNNLERGRFGKDAAASLTTADNLKILEKIGEDTFDPDETVEYKDKKRNSKELWDEFKRKLQAFAERPKDEQEQEASTMSNVIDSVRE